MLKTITLLCLLYRTLQFSIHKISPRVSHSGKLGFENYTATCFNDEFQTDAIQILRDAYVIYQSDQKATLAFIYQQIYSLYGSVDQDFDVLLNVQNVGGYDWGVYSDGGCFVLSYGVGIVPQSGYSYMIIQHTPNSDYVQIYSDGSVGRGGGMSGQMATGIQQIINNNENGMTNCNCDSLFENVWNQITDAYNGYWAVFCNQGYPNNMLVYAMNDQWINYAGKCFYQIYLED